MWAEVSSSAPHLIHNGLSYNPIRWRCFLRGLCPIRRPVTALDYVLLKDRNLALAPRRGPGINSWARLWVSPRPRHHIQCWLTNQHLILRISCLETPKDGWSPTDFRTGPSLASSLAMQLGWHSPYSDMATCWEIQCTIPSKGMRFFCSPKHPDWVCGPPNILLIWYQASFSGKEGVSSQDMWLASLLHLMLM